jgi:hypothetical protein
MAFFQISANDVDMGEYRADNAAAALDAYAKEAGYPDYKQLAAEVGDDATAVQIDTDALCQAVERMTGRTVVQDSYGRGVALVNDVSYATHQELAQSIGKNCWDFRA